MFNLDEALPDDIYAQAIKRALAKRQEPEQEGWEGVKPEVDARLPPRQPLRPTQPVPAVPPDIHMPEDPVQRMGGAAPVGPPPGQFPSQPKAPTNPQVQPEATANSGTNLRPRGLWGIGGTGGDDPTLLPNHQAQMMPLQRTVPPQAQPTYSTELPNAQAADAAENKRRLLSADLLAMAIHHYIEPQQTHDSVMALQARQMAQKQAEAERQAKMAADPLSPVSQQARARFRALMPELAAKMGGDFEGIPASALPSFGELLKDQPKPKAPLSPLEQQKLQSEIRLNEANAGKAEREPMAKPEAPHEPPFDPVAFKQTGMKENPGFLKEFKKQRGFKTDQEAFAAIDKLPNDKAALEALERDMAGTGKGITMAVVGGQVSEGNKVANEDREEAGKTSAAWDDTDQSLRLLAEQRQLVNTYGRNLFAPTNAEERAAQKRAISIGGQLKDFAQKATIDANRMPNNTVYQNVSNDIIGHPERFGLGALLDGPENQLAAADEYEKTLLHKRSILKAHYDALPDDAKKRHPLYMPQTEQAPKRKYEKQANGYGYYYENGELMREKL